ncbi:hypothetical protein GTQ40_15690 [Flavobacteriaceae bacterium R38]|nr:hypothetical protein [Flavobacteriaceae bacterium R38]
MKNKYQCYNYAIAFTFIWIGFVCAISFMEAWLKFQAPGITIKLGLGIGQLVFTALNKVEITCALLITVSVLYLKFTKVKINILLLPLIIALIIISMQTVWLLPALNHRATFIINGIDVPKSRLHLWYVLLEVLKVISLFVYGFKLLNNRNKININQNNK